MANLIGADPKEIIFTSGATESNNLAVKGVAGFHKDKKRHIITTQTEHKCVLDSCRYLQQRGWDVTYLPVQANGLVDLQQLEEAIRPDTALVSVMMVNNEIGMCRGGGGGEGEEGGARGGMTSWYMMVASVCVWRGWFP